MAVGVQHVAWEICLLEGCRGVRAGASGACLGHLSAEELRVSFSTAPQPVHLDGRGVQFDRQSLARVLDAIPTHLGRRVVGAACFDGATFSCDVPFDTATFAGPASFRGAVFEASVRLVDATFESDAFFGDAHFAGPASFIGCRFRGPTTFAGASFTSPASFQQAGFSDGAWFDDATFAASTFFVSSSFAFASFSRTTFRHEARFDGATFGGESRWDHVAFAIAGQRPPPAATGVTAAVPVPTFYGDRPAPAGWNVGRRPAARRRYGVLLACLLAVILIAGTAFTVRPEPEGSSIASAPSPSTEPTASTFSPGRSDDYSFLAVDSDGQPARVNPCRPVRYVVNPTGAPEGWRTMLDDALTELSAATGLTFEDFGSTTDEKVVITAGLAEGRFQGERDPFQPTRYAADDWAPVLIQWSDFPATRAGEPTATAKPNFKRNADGKGVIVSGSVAINISTTPYDLQANFMHELGHILGLGHAKSTTQVMGESHVPGAFRPRWGAGDRTALGLVGRTAGCLTPPAPP